MSPGRIIGVIVAGLVVAAVVIVGALSLGGTSQIAPPDEAQPIVVGVVAAPGQELTGATDLPPLAMVLDQPPAADIVDLSASGQVDRYKAQAQDDDAASLVRLGAAQQRAGDQDGAAESYRRAAQVDPRALAPRIGLAMADAATGDAGMARGTAQLNALARANPGSQLAWFNRGWLATYRRDARAVIASWRRVVDLDRSTPLGKTALALLKGIAKQAARGGGTRTTG